MDREDAIPPSAGSGSRRTTEEEVCFVVIPSNEFARLNPATLVTPAFPCSGLICLQSTNDVTKDDEI